MFLVPYSNGRSTCISNRLHDFYITSHRCYKDVYLKFISLHNKTLDVFPYRFIPLTYDPNDSNPRVNKLFLSLGSS